MAVDPPAALGDLSRGTETHLNAPAVVVRPEAVREALSTLREEADLDRFSCVTAQEYADRHETTYHLRSYDDPTREVGVVVPAPTSDPRSESAAPVSPTAAWRTTS